jgi:hypothetical protein
MVRIPLCACAVLFLLAVSGCGSPAAVGVTSNTPTVLPAPTLAPQTALAEVPTPTAVRAPTVRLTSTPRPAPATRTPTVIVPPAARTDGLPLPPDARDTKNIPDTVRQFAQAQLKGFTRVGQPRGYLSPHAIDQVVTLYQQALVASGWENVPITASGLDQTQLLVAQKDKLEAIIALVNMDADGTLVYITTVAKK